MKKVADLTEEELRAELEKILIRKAKRAAYSRSHQTRWETILQDPKAYFTRRRDWIEAERNAERFGWDLEKIPKLNVTAVDVEPYEDDE